MLLNATLSLVSLSPLQCSNESIGERRLTVDQRRRCCLETIEGNIEAPQRPYIEEDDEKFGEAET